MSTSPRFASLVSFVARQQKVHPSAARMAMVRLVGRLPTFRRRGGYRAALRASEDALSRAYLHGFVEHDPTLRAALARHLEEDKSGTVPDFSEHELRVANNQEPESASLSGFVVHRRRRVRRTPVARQPLVSGAVSAPAPHKQKKAKKHKKRKKKVKKAKEEKEVEESRQTSGCVQKRHQSYDLFNMSFSI